MPNEFSKEELEAMFSRLSEPFDLADVQWVVKSTSKDGKSALVAPYADPRAYHRRLDEVVTAAGWSNEYKNQIVPGLTHMLKDKMVPSGKVAIVCSLSIYALSATKSATGECWADDENAVTRAEAQAFKRACAMFGVGAYFYRIKNGVDNVKLWVNYDAQKRRITQEPQLPDWALSESDKANRHPHKNSPAQTAPTARPQPVAVAKPAPAPAAHVQSKSVNYVKDLGRPLYDDVVSKIDNMVSEGKVSGDRNATLKSALEKALVLLESVRARAAEMPVNALDALLDRVGVKQLDMIPNYAVLREIAKGVIEPTQTAA